MVIVAVASAESVVRAVATHFAVAEGCQKVVADSSHQE